LNHISNSYPYLSIARHYADKGVTYSDVLDMAHSCKRPDGTMAEETALELASLSSHPWNRVWGDIYRASKSFNDILSGAATF
jgi:hypothetical protein